MGVATVRTLDLSRPADYRLYLEAARAVGCVLPEDVTCPECGAAPGQRCRRPSGYRAYGGRPHRDRYEAAGGEYLTDEEYARVRVWLRQRGYYLPDRRGQTGHEQARLAL